MASQLHTFPEEEAQGDNGSGKRSVDQSTMHVLSSLRTIQHDNMYSHHYYRKRRIFKFLVKSSQSVSLFTQPRNSLLALLTLIKLHLAILCSFSHCVAPALCFLVSRTLLNCLDDSGWDWDGGKDDLFQSRSVWVDTSNVIAVSRIIVKLIEFNWISSIIVDCHQEILHQLKSSLLASYWGISINIHITRRESNLLEHKYSIMDKSYIERTIMINSTTIEINQYQSPDFLLGLKFWFHKFESSSP